MTKEILATKEINELDYGKLRERMDDDAALFYLEHFVLKNPDNTKEPMPNSVSLTLNDARTFGDRCLAILGADKRSFDITGVDASLQHKIEADFLHWLYVNDEQLEISQMESLEDNVNFFDLIRGWIGGLALMYQQGDKYLPSILPIDSRWMTWKVGQKGLSEFSYRIWMDRLLAQERFSRKITGTNKTVMLHCIWDIENYSIGLGGTSSKVDILQSNPHGLGICPGIIVPVPTQPVLISGKEDYPTSLSRQGESIYAPNRDLYPTINMVASILASIMQESYLSSIVYAGKKEGFDKSPAGAGKYVQIDPDESITLMPARDLNRATEYLFGILGSGKQRGSLSDINYGQIAFELSALAVAQLKDDRDGIFVPRRKAKKTFYRRAFNILRHQVINGGFKLEAKEFDEELAIEIDKTLYVKRCTVNINFNSISPEENITNYTTGNQAVALGIPLRKVLKDILHDSDPDGTMREGELEKAHDIIPLLRLYDMAIATDPDTNLKEEEINKDRALIIYDEIKRQMKANKEGLQPPTLNAIRQPASQPKQTAKPGRESSEKMAAAKLKQTGLTNAQNAKRSSNAGG